MTLRFAVILLAGCILTGCSAIAGCGLERWPVKDALDHDARKIDLSPRDSTIAYLTALPAPPTPSGRYDMRYAPVETTVYRISATLAPELFAGRSRLPPGARRRDRPHDDYRG